ncbi:MAG: hypothetical protein KAS32_06805 [Candidatus Peribacteraceae bacterium]|nr:hypothetical protein [Candidatus Peribacteraceae bacterium]
MPKTKESIKAYNKEYFARPEVIARAKIRNAKYRKRRAEYKKTERGKRAELRYRRTESSKKRCERNRLKYLYGITPEQREAMVVSQEGKCGICKKKKKLDIDHCHETNRIRGLLCGSCNRAMGLLKDNTSFLLNAIKYLTCE